MRMPGLVRRSLSGTFKNAPSSPAWNSSTSTLPPTIWNSDSTLPLSREALTARTYATMRLAVMSRGETTLSSRPSRTSWTRLALLTLAITLRTPFDEAYMAARMLPSSSPVSATNASDPASPSSSSSSWSATLPCSTVQRGSSVESSCARAASRSMILTPMPALCSMPAR